MDLDSPESELNAQESGDIPPQPPIARARWSRRSAHTLTALLLCAFMGDGVGAVTNDIYVRFKVVEPAAERLRVLVGGHLHQGPDWGLRKVRIDIAAGEWSDWIDLTRWPLHRRTDRSGGVAEWPSLTLQIQQNKTHPIEGVAFDVQLADSPDESKVVVSFTEKGGANGIGFLLPHPLREHKSEFETGSAMAARHAAWAKEATGDRAASLERFELVTSLAHYDPTLAAQEVQSLKRLGFNVIAGGSAPVSALEEEGLATLGKTWAYRADPADTIARWQKFLDKSLARSQTNEDQRWRLDNMAQFVVADEVSAVKFDDVDPDRRNGWFQDYLRGRGITDAELGTSVGGVVHPTQQMAKRAPTTATLPHRRVFYYAAKFGHEWSARQLRQTSDLVRKTFRGIPTQTLPTSHGFFGAPGPPRLGMSAPLLDLFALGRQQSVDVLAAEDWLGLNHMYGPRYTWSGAQSFAYLNAILRSGIGDAPMRLQSLITPSDDRYLRLKAFSSLAQGAKSFFFWRYGPTFVSTENYWSDLRSEYDGIAKFTRALQKAEPVLYPARPVSDPVAILYSVSHDIWHADDPAAFVETRLLWHALRHLGYQPDFLREEDVEAGALARYKVLYLAGHCLTRRASAAVDRWVREGGIAQLSAGAATRDEFFEPYIPPFASSMWPDAAALKLEKQDHEYNERTDLPKIKPITRVQVTIGKGAFTLPVLGQRVRLPETHGADRVATFEDGGVAGLSAAVGRGRVIALGFLPMLAYGQLAGFQPEDLAERWPAAPRALVQLALAAAAVRPRVASSVPVVEATLLTGPEGSAIVLANYTYEPIRDLELRVAFDQRVTEASSVEGKSVRVSHEGGRVILHVPLDWTDIILLPRP